MAQLWSNTGQGYMASDILSEDWRTSLQPLSRFRQFCDVEEAIGKNAGEVFNWTIYGDTVDNGTRELQETQPMPTTSFPVFQGSVTITEFGISIPHSLKFETMSQHNVPEVITKTLRNDAHRKMDEVAWSQFDATILKAAPTGGNHASNITLDDDGTTAITNGIALGKGHVKTIRDLMEERNIPVFDGEDYVAIMRPTTMRPMVNELETVNQYTDEGYKRIVNGERGRYEGIRFLTQTNIASEGWSGGLSDAAYFFGADTVTEAIAVPEELRGKIPDDYGRSKGIAWYYLGNFKITHADQTSAESKAQARIIKWDSTA